MGILELLDSHGVQSLLRSSVLLPLVAAGVAWGDDKQPAPLVPSSAPDRASATFEAGLFITRNGVVVEPP